MATLFRILACLLLPTAWAQTPLSEARMRADLDYLASQELRGRRSMDAGSDRAARYIAAEFEKAGLQPANGNSFLQEFRLVTRQLPGRARLRFQRAGKTSELDFGIDVSTYMANPVTVKAPLAFAGYGITAPEYDYDDYAGLDVRGKIVVIFDHEPQEADAQSVFNGAGDTRHAARWLKTRNAQAHGAAGVLLASEPLRKHPGWFDPQPGAATAPRSNSPVRPQLLVDTELRIPVLTIPDGTLSDLLASSGKAPAGLQQSIDDRLRPASFLVPDVVVEMRTGGGRQARGRSFNVAGALEGTDPALRGQTVLVCAHYDHLGKRDGAFYAGANDNASGTAGVLELARAFAGRQTTPRPKRTILFVAFGSEEQGLLGSYYYAAHPLRTLAGTVALNLDMIGRNEAPTPRTAGVLEISADTSNEVNLIGTYYSPELRQIVLEQGGTAGLTINLKFDRDHNLGALFGSDHLPFLLHGVPAAQFFAGPHPGSHEPSDTVGNLDFAKLMKVANLAYLTTGSLADAPSLPRFAPDRR